MDSKLKFYLIMLMGLNHLKKEIKCLNTLGTKSLITKSYFYRKRILLRMHLTNGEMVFKDRYFFLMELRILVEGFLGNKKIKWKKIRTDNNDRVIVLEA